MSDTTNAMRPAPQIPSEPTQRGARSRRWWMERSVGPLLFLLAGIALIVGVGIAQRAGWMSAGGETAGSAGANTAAIFTCSMDPQIRQPGPGRCPICGMALVRAVASGGDGLDDLSIQIEPAQRRLANIQTAEVKLEPVFTSIKTVGSIAIDESRMATIASYIDGRIERIFADYTGVNVAKGDHLAVVYSPELFSAQVEYLENRKSLAALRPAWTRCGRLNEGFVINARRKLQELGLTEDQIGTLESTGKANSRQTNLLGHRRNGDRKTGDGRQVHQSRRANLSDR